MKFALPAFVLISLIYFGIYSLVPIFGLDELWPGLFGYKNQLVGLMFVVLMLLGGLYWRGFWIKSQKRQGRRDD